MIQQSGDIKLIESQGDYVKTDLTDLIEREGNNYWFTANISTSIIIERNDIILDGNGYTLKGYGTGIGLNLTTNNVTVKNINIIEWDVGILGPYNDNTIMGNSITKCKYGINLISNYNTIINNYVANNEKGIFIGRVSSFNFISKNYFANNDIGLEIFSYDSIGGNTITENNIALNKLGIYVTWHRTGLMQNIYRNNFIENTKQVSTSGSSPIFGKKASSTWNNGSIGNYWSDYKGPDSNSDGIGDSPYIINDYDKDTYPLMSPLTLEIIPEFPLLTVLFIGFFAMTAILVVSRRRI